MSRRTQRVLLVVLLIAFINLPMVHSTWVGWQVDRDGVDVTAEVVQTEILGSDDAPEYWVAFRFDEELDPEERAWPARVDRATWDDARATEEIEVRVLEDNPAAYRAEGRVPSRVGLAITLVADGILLLILLVVRRGRRSPTRPVRISALGDVERCPPGTAWEELDDGIWLARGEVVDVDDDEIVLDVGDRDVVVILDGHHNEVGWQQPAQVRGRLVP